MHVAFRFKRWLPAVALALLGGCAQSPARVNQPVEIRVGETRAVGPDGLALTLRSVSDDSGCLSATDCSKALFNGSIAARKGEQSDLIQAQAILQQDQGLTFDFHGYKFLLTGVRRDKQNRATATFVVPEAMHSYVIPERKDGDALLARNKTKPGVITTADGLQYQVLVEGSGARPAATDSVEVRYVCAHADGAACDVKAAHQVSTFDLRDVIQGWSEGLQLMPVGSKYRFVIPPELAYGEHPPGSIAPNETLVFEVELLGIVPSGK